MQTSMHDSSHTCTQCLVRYSLTSHKFQLLLAMRIQNSPRLQIKGSGWPQSMLRQSPWYVSRAHGEAEAGSPTFQLSTISSPVSGSTWWRQTLAVSHINKIAEFDGNCKFCFSRPHRTYNIKQRLAHLCWLWRYEHISEHAWRLGTYHRLPVHPVPLEVTVATAVVGVGQRRADTASVIYCQANVVISSHAEMYVNTVAIPF